MDKQKQAEIISIGTEILMGEITDTNAGYIASQLPLLGFSVQRVTTAGDNEEQLCQVLRQAVARSTLVITSGGLGPTEDDLTRECIAATLDEEPAIDADLEEQLRARFGRMGRNMPPHNLKQAWLIPSAKGLPNPRGTAPGWWVEKDGTTIVAMPGPPREMIPMWQNEVTPRLRERYPGEAILSRTIKTYALHEAQVAEMVMPFFESENPILGIYAKQDGIQLRLIAYGDNAAQLIKTTEEQIEEIMSPYVWGKDDDSLSGLISGWLIDKGLTLATIEDGTSGLLANMIHNTPGSSKFYRGGLIAPSDEMKISFGVSEQLVEEYGLISGESAEAMAAVAREKFSADFGLSTTGVMAPGNPGGQPPGSTYIGIDDKDGKRNWQQNFARFREEAGPRETIAALFRLRERLIELEIANPYQ